MSRRYGKYTEDKLLDELEGTASALSGVGEDEENRAKWSEKLSLLAYRLGGEFGWTWDELRKKTGYDILGMV